MTRERIFSIALLCGLGAFFWTLIARPPQSRRDAPRGVPGYRFADPPRDRPGAEAQVLARPDDQAWFIVATLRQAAGDGAAAREAWEQTARTATEPGAFQPRGTFLLGWAREQLGDAAGAKAAFEAAAAGYEAGLDPNGQFANLPQAWMRLAWCRKKLGDDAGSQAAWDRAQEIIDRTHPAEMRAGTMYDRACCLAQRGDTGAAIWSLREAAKKGFHDREWAAADENLAPIRENPGFKDWMDGRDAE